MKDQNTIIEKLLKIKELAERGYKGEATQAQAQLEKLLRKYNLTIRDLEKEETQSFFIPYSNPSERRILSQIISMYNLDPYTVSTTKIVKGKPKKRFIRNLAIYCNAFTYSEIIHAYTFYRAEFKKSLEDFTSAFIHKNKLFPATPKTDRIGKAPERTIEEKYKAWRIANMMEGINKSQYQSPNKIKQLA